MQPHRFFASAARIAVYREPRSEDAGKDVAGEAAQTEEEWADENEVNDVGEGDDEGEDFEEMAESASEKDENEGEEPA